MSSEYNAALSEEHRDFYERFKSFWDAPTGPRVAEIIRPEAQIHFSGQETFSGADYIDVMSGMLDSMEDLNVIPVDCAGAGELLYIHWTASAVVNGKPQEWLGVDRFRIEDGMAIEEHVIFDPSFLQES